VAQNKYLTPGIKYTNIDIYLLAELPSALVVVAILYSSKGVPKSLELNIYRGHEGPRGALPVAASLDFSWSIF
jgi:hypothetical protein